MAHRVYKTPSITSMQRRRSIYQAIFIFLSFLFYFSLPSLCVYQYLYPRELALSSRHASISFLACLSPANQNVLFVIPTYSSTLIKNPPTVPSINPAESGVPQHSHLLPKHSIPCPSALRPPQALPFPRPSTLSPSQALPFHDSSNPPFQSIPGSSPLLPLSPASPPSAPAGVRCLSAARHAYCTNTSRQEGGITTLHNWLLFLSCFSDQPLQSFSYVHIACRPISVSVTLPANEEATQGHVKRADM